jgi:CubicO group peptidase (beta-lactamase class C family)
MTTARCLAVVFLILAVFSGPAHAGDTPVTGPVVPGLESFDKLMTGFLAEHDGVGAALAVTRNGKLVYARGFGWADRDARVKAAPDSLFRIASLSKSITAAAVLQLVERGKLRLTDTPFTMLKISPVLQPGTTPDPRLAKITILELLQHRGGFDRDKSLDPMFQSVNFAKLCGVPSPAMQGDIIRVMAGRPLDFDPGEKFAYSNFGYCVLGRMIESAGGDGYEGYIRKNIFGPMKIAHIRLGRTLLKDRAPGEVMYYTANDDAGRSVFAPVGQKVPEPYGAWCVEAMDSHGGWIASAPELVKFASAWDDPDAEKVLSRKSVAAMFDRPPVLKPEAVWYGCGWDVRDVGRERINTWHTGLLPGTSTLMVRRSDGLDWVVLFNQDRDKDGKVLSDLIDPLVHQAADAVKRWPVGVERGKVWP